MKQERSVDMVTHNNDHNNKDIKVVILCGGLGTRLREETEFRPKPMVNIGNRPILWHIMKIYSHYGFKDFILCLGYKGETIKEFFLNYEVLNSDFTIELGNGKNLRLHNCHEEKDWRITLADTGDKTLKGARLKMVEKYLDGDTFMVTYGDGLADVDLNALLRFHLGHGKLATVTGVNPASRFGELKIKGNMVESFSEKPEISKDFINGGFFVFNKAVMDYLSVKDGCDLEIGPLERIANDGHLIVNKHQGSWACMDTLRDMEYLNRLWDEGRAFWKVWEDRT
jgi:glucose-1-phosphate cytidylyltransferase